MKSTIDWLLQKDQPSIRYRALTELLDYSQNDSDVQAAYRRIPNIGWAKKILKEQLPDFYNFKGYWHNYTLLNRPKYIATVWKFLVLADLGVNSKNKQLLKTCKLLSERYLKQKENYHLCMTANIARAFLRAGYEEDNRVSKALDWLVSVQKDDGGWHCFESRKGTLDCWEPLATFAELPQSRWSRKIKNSADRGAEFYLRWRLYREGHKKYEPWFRFHYPIHYYYDLLVGLEVLSLLGYGNDERMRFAIELLRKKQRSDGRWNLDALNPDLGRNLPRSSYSIDPPWEPFPAIPFGLENVGEPSKIITLRALKVLKTIEDDGH